MHNRIIKLTTAILVCIVCVAAAYAQDGRDDVAVSALRPPVGTVRPSCKVSMTVAFASDKLGNSTFVATGRATFKTTAVTTDDDVAGNTEQIVGLSATATNDAIGTITWTLADGDATPTTINANQKDADFPATSDIYFTPEATISSQPGSVYQPQSEVHLHSENLNSFDPQNSESYTSDSKIDFYDVKSGELAFSITLSDITVSGVPDDEILRPDIGLLFKCPASWHTKFTSNEIGTVEFDAKAAATFVTASVTGQDEAAGNTQTPVALDASASEAKLGTIEWRFSDNDVAAKGTATAITANQNDANFPATSDIYFTPIARLSAHPGVVYKASREVHLQNTNLTTFFPQQSESYTIVDGPIDFVDQATKKYAFTIELSNFVVGGDNAAGNENNLEDDPLLGDIAR
ncbi:MAG TPA: hypothetical protein VHI13_02180 [Candidatus Kapabacteria bacterium]|nr:hypothetical protein [Candidatus Kapabacteria bacterium]